MNKLILFVILILFSSFVNADILCFDNGGIKFKFMNGDGRISTDRMIITAINKETKKEYNISGTWWFWDISKQKDKNVTILKPNEEYTFKSNEAILNNPGIYYINVYSKNEDEVVYREGTNCPGYLFSCQYAYITIENCSTKENDFNIYFRTNFENPIKDFYYVVDSIKQLWNSLPSSASFNGFGYKWLLIIPQSKEGNKIKSISMDSKYCEEKEYPNTIKKKYCEIKEEIKEKQNIPNITELNITEKIVIEKEDKQIEKKELSFFEKIINWLKSLFNKV